MARTSDPERNGRLASTWSLPPLSLIVASFFLPALKTCDRVESMAGIAGDEILAWLGIGAPYWTALVLLGLTIAALVKRGPSRGLERAAIVTLALGSLGVVGAALALVLAGGADVRLAVAVIPLPVLPGLAAVRALRREGWARWARFLGAYAILASFFAVLFVVVLFDQGASQLGAGAWLYIVADVVLLGIAGWVIAAALIRPRE